jgi:hypothetical protein
MMSKAFILMTGLYVATSAFVFGQGTLQFNRVLLVEQVDQTVPAGKVWKVESYTPSSSYGIHTGTPQNHVILVNSQSRIVGMSAGYNINYNGGAHGSGTFSSFPMWLPAGSILRASTNVSQLSVIEFNVIP